MPKNRMEKGERLVVTFEAEPSKETKNKIKSLGMHWNRFRREWNGFGKKEQAETVLEGTGAIIETIGDIMAQEEPF